MQVSATEDTIAVIMDAKEARELLSIVLGSRRETTNLSHLIVGLDTFVNGSDDE